MTTNTITLADVANRNREYLDTVFTLGDGHFGVPAGAPFDSQYEQQARPKMFVNGFFETNPIVYGESAYGYAKMSQTIVALPSPRQLELSLAGKNTQNAEDWQITLQTMQVDLTSGSLTEAYLLNCDGNQFTLTIKSVLVQDGSHHYRVQYTLCSKNYTGPLAIKRTLLKPKVDVAASTFDPRVVQRAAELKETVDQITDVSVTWTTATTRTKQRLMQQETLVVGSSLMKFETGAWQGQLDCIAGQVVTLEFNRAVGEVNQPLSTMALPDFSALVGTNQRILDNFWQHADVEISDAKLQMGIRYNLFQLFQSAGRDGRTNIAAKGVTGAGYEGHYFWDTEMYMLPFFIYTQPQIAKKLLAYRYHVLPQARQRARELGVAAGALFAWRTINGEEASAYFPAGTAQYHINADISHAVKLYYDVTGDTDFLREQGAEIVVETARFWAAYGSWQENQFCFYKVTGPDEYTALVDNNYYTNRLAKENLAFAAWLTHHGFSHATVAEGVEFDKLAAAVYLPYDEQVQVTAQDDNSPKMPVWPFDDTPASNYPLLLHYHPLAIYRHRVNKQADTLLAEMLFPADQSKSQLQRDFDYYEKITTHDSSLSRSIFSILASRLDLGAKAFSYYMDTALMDLTDLQGNTADGLHEANLGGSWLGLTYGFSGLTAQDGQLQLANHLPVQLQFLRYRLSFQDRLLQVNLTPTDLTVDLLSGKPLTIMINGEICRLK